MIKTILQRSLFFILCTGFFESLVAQDTLAHWGFNEGSGSITKENTSNTNFTIKSNWPVVEWVPGIKSSAMRTDGYSVWAEGTLTGSLPSTAITIYAWVAPEVYPVSDAAVWAQYDSASKLGAWIGIDKYGRLKVEFNKGGLVLSYVSTATLTHYAWNYLVVNINAQSGTITGYINAVKTIDFTFNPGSISWPSSKKTFVGKLPKGETNGLYPINTMNAIIDEVALLKSALAQTAITQLYQQGKPASSPDMKTPATRFANDFLRPKYHPIPASNWCNESHGLIYDNGKYHLFYQKNGNGSYLFQQNWGHLESTDLVSWQEVVPALWPQPGWDNYGIWSGHAIKDQNNTPTIFYTGVDGIKAGIGKAAPATTDLLQWQKSILNPVIPHAPTTYPNKDFRDCYLFKENGTWYMIVGSGLLTPNVGTVFLYKSADLNSWQFIKPMYSGDPLYTSSGIFWEMPVFWNFGDKHLLLVNRVPQPGIPAKSLYWAGDFTNESFVPDNPFPKSLELFNRLLSPTVNYDLDSNVTAIGIIPDLIPSSVQYKNGYANLFSLPRVWQLRNDSLLQSPHPSLKKLRGDSTEFNNVNITTTGTGFLGTTKGFQLEISASITGATADQAGLILGKNADNSEYTKIYYDYRYSEVVLDLTHSSTNPLTQGDMQSAPLSLGRNTPIDWHIFIDGSVMEVFINNRYAFATRYYPVSANSDGVDLFATGSTATANVKIWNINPEIILPATWLSFNATNQNNKTVQLQWTVSQEINVDHYEVERSTNGINFQSIGTQAAANNYDLTKTYTFTDYLPITGNNYYRITDVDKDAKLMRSVVKNIIIAINKNPALIQLLQNPSKNLLSLKVLSDAGRISFSLWGIAAGKVFQSTVQNALKDQVINIPVHNLSAGVYLLNVISGNKKESYKIVVN